MIFFKFKSLLTSRSPTFFILNYEKKHKEGLCKVLGRSVVFSAFYADFFLCRDYHHLNGIIHVVLFMGNCPKEREIQLH